ncbi:lysosomal Pro-X carboxypeptidase isoform X1 [Mastomys coucha]|uniref:lysosomal Pro-X carboxypeptidase isoform X1 n=2 Tax=Mastomys coucha TaxID=35658 RepID=UPI001262303F|nr:lysosomal Pro-X carboxypeptidase isoform X1 [Mastomys coucha]
MGCRALLLLPFLSLGAATTIRPRLKTLGSPHLSAYPTPDPAVARKYSVFYFQQKVDHFGFSDTRTFKQRYLVADKHWQRDGGSILFYTGNEGDIVWFCNNTGFMWDVAEELKAMLVFAEHRYYGESLPFGQDSFKDSQHLNFLTSEQALADFAELIRHLKKAIPGAKSQPVIAIGGSYGGMLAAWFRMKYPHIVVGALAASAPIWQLDGMVPCGEFMKIVTKDFEKSGPYCTESIRKSWSVINQLSGTGSGLQWLTNTLHLCSPLTSETISTLKGWIAETWVNLAMVNYPYACNFLQPLPAWPIKEVCQYLKNPNVSDTVLVQNIFQALNVYYNYSGQAKCLNISQTSTSSLGSMGWNFQACTEMVMPICSNGIDDMFEPFLWDLESYSNDCFNQWGVRPRPHWMITMYGGKNISSHSNIIFSNGDLDPWSGGGVTKDITDTLVAINILEGAHHLDLRAHNAFDPSSVLLSRLLEVKHMKKWIADFYSNAK